MKVNAVYKLLDRPLIYGSVGSGNWQKLKNTTGEKAWILTHPMWHVSFKSLLFYIRLNRQCKKIGFNLIVLCNQELEVRRLKAVGIKALFLHQNIHCNEHIFRPLPEIEKVYDAVYTAQAKPFKRIELAALIKQLYIVTYFWPDVRDANGKWDLHAFEPRVRHCEFNNDRITPDTVNERLNAAHCGLALSGREGAMYAAMEYQMAGLPVVTTPSLGGREYFFRDWFVERVAAEPEAVRKGVANIRQREIDPMRVRTATMEMVKGEREKFWRLVGELAGDRFSEDFDTFHDRVWGSQTALNDLRVF